MFEAHVLLLLKRYLGEYVQGLSAEALRISVWNGDVVLRDLKLKAEALNSLELPVTVKAGFIGTITLKVPWKSLGKEPVVVLIDRVFVLAHPVSDHRALKEKDREKLFEAKLQQIEEAEAATIEATLKSKLSTPSSGYSWLGSLIATIIGNLKISISNVHVRYEDPISNPGNPFSLGITLAKLAAVTMDEQGNETFDTSGALDKLRKSVQLERLAFYHDSCSRPWKTDKNWEDLTPTEWVEIFEDGINEPVSGNDVVSKWAARRSYLVSPINGLLKYHRLGKQERNDPEVPFEKAALELTDVFLTMTEAQYCDWIKLFEVVSRYRIHVEISHLRPVVPVSEKPCLWWRYAVQASLQLKKVCYRFSWDQIHHLCQLRRHYVQLYAAFLQRPPDVEVSQLREIEKDLDPKVILLWRLLGHAKVESAKSKEAAEQQRLQKKGWFSFGWRATSEDDLKKESSEGSQIIEGKLTKEEWQAINNLLSHERDEDFDMTCSKDMQNMARILVTIAIGQAGARIFNRNGTEVVHGRFEQLDVSAKLKSRSKHCHVSLKFYGLSSPEGSIAESVSNEQKANALAATFVSMPEEENVDWRLSATISPCHVTIFMESYYRFLEFIKRSNAISPTVALETATALQTKIERVTRRAQEQFQMVLEEKSRFALDIDLDAPKVRVPIRRYDSSIPDGYFILDFGHFTLQTQKFQNSQFEEQRQKIYSRFYISGRDIAAFFTDGSSGDSSCAMVNPCTNTQQIASPLANEADLYCYLIDPCGMAVIVDQIKVPHPDYPSTCISVQVPNLSMHISPSRYRKLMELLNMFYGAQEIAGQSNDHSFPSTLTSWDAIDLASNARILVWRGIGHSVATWQQCFLVLSGLHLYVLESEKSQNYQRSLRIAGKQIHEVPSLHVGGSPFCIAVSFRGMDTRRALETSSTWVLELQNEEDRALWLKGLIQATYLASVPPSIDAFSERTDDITELGMPHVASSKVADIVISGSLVEAELYVYGQSVEKGNMDPEEKLLIEVLAGGGKVHVICCEGDLTVKCKLHSLKIKDVLQGRHAADPQFLAYSVLKNENLSRLSTESQSHDPAAMLSDDDDIFKDALPDFLLLSESGIHAHNMDVLDDINNGTGFEPTDVFYEAEGSNGSSFVALTFSTRNSGSPDYDGIDTQMAVSMSKLEFFCNRPTLVALITFGLDLSSINAAMSAKGPMKSVDDEDKEKVDDTSRVKGLLGFGKGRVVFNLRMIVDSVSLFLNKEDGSQLAVLVQENFLLDIKVFPSSLSIEGNLGNFRLRDMSFGEDHFWSWLCDIRNPDVDSLIKFKFCSYSAEDDDYEGYDYSLRGRLSAVRIVFLYRFVQEFTAYFMGLATPHAEEAIRLVDKVGDFEWLIQKYEIDGSSAVKLDLSLDTPIIVVPRNSLSKDFIQLDLGQLQVTNEFSWHGVPEEDPSAVHVDFLHAEISGINMAVGINGVMGKAMIREGQGIGVHVRRSLRDVFRKIPTFSLEVGQLHAMVSDKEYSVIVDSLYMNLCELPRLPPNFRGSSSGSIDTMKLLADRVNVNGQLMLSRTVTVIAVEVSYALLELCNGIDDKSPLAHIALEGLWVSYRSTSLFETDLYVTLPRFSVLDIRPETKSEMRLMLGSSSDSSRISSAGDISFLSRKPSRSWKTSLSGLELAVPCPTMFLMDYRWRASSHSVVVRIQQPRVLVVPDFLLAVGEFFVPSLGTITGREETMDPRNDPVTKNKTIVLSEPVYKQHEDIVHLSPDRQLVADALGINEYVYDGCGKTIHLSGRADLKESHMSRSDSIVFIGRGKKLRFVNVKIENGALLRKYTYLSNDSSYSILFEDGVQISLLEKVSAENDIDDWNTQYDATDTSSAHLLRQSDSKYVQNYTFEGQVISPEFTFYDSTKSFLEDTSQGERLLRAKLDLSFMYAVKENDTWIRALVKDFMVEAGSGLIILNPLDLSGGYTSVKERTNISLLSSDVCVHLSLSAISLMINLLNQATMALQFGNAVPLAPCTNLDQIWVSPKDCGPYGKLAFWRPQAPTNYVIMGDCVTSRLIPPSQTVMSVSNTYGRVRKPVGFNLMGTVNEGDSHSDGICSIWMPIAPPGYTALGCVVHPGNQSPPNHIVHCLRSDLVTSTVYSECMYTVESGASTSGFSIWRLDNAVGSFIAHSSTECPQSDLALDLSYILLWNSIQRKVSSADSTRTGYGGESQQANNQNATPSGWDVLRSISKATNSYMSTPHFERIWWDKGNEVRRPVSVWRPVARPGYAALGDCITEGLEPPVLGIIFKSNSAEVSAKPAQFTKVAQIAGKGLDEVFFWYPIAPPGYVSLGCVASRTDKAPPLEKFCCPRMDIVNRTNIPEVPISRSCSSKGSHCWSIWKVDNQASTFLARSDLRKPSNKLAYAICDSAKPKTRDNITAEMKLRRLSLTVLDSLCGMMTPLFDTTVTNIKLATHGRLEAMNAVFVSSIAASTFNAKLEAWEPLVEPFDGIFKFETYSTDEQISSRLGKRVRVAATSILNVNVTAANLETFVETVVSWRRMLELEQKSAKLNEEAGRHRKSGQDFNFSALDEDDFQTVIVENKLGSDIYLKKVEDSEDDMELLQHDESVSIWIPPPRFADRLNVAEELREARYYVAVQIIEAKGIPIVDDGNSHNLFCALRLVIDSQATEQQKLFPQSARTKCVKPVIFKDKGNASWNELFIFEVPRKGMTKLEVEVTNLAAKAGKGEVVGAFSFPVGHGANTLKKLSSSRLLYQPHDAHSIVSYPLKRRQNEEKNVERIQDIGILSVSTSFFERKTGGNIIEDSENGDNINKDIGFWIAVSEGGEWECVRSLLPLSVAPRLLNNDFIAMEVAMKNGKKHVVFRGLVSVLNDSDVRMELALCSSSSAQRASNDSVMIVISPGTSAVLPWRYILKDSQYCLQFRPCYEEPQLSYSWGRTVAIGFSSAAGKEQTSSDLASLSRQKDGAKNSNYVLRLNQIEKNDLLLCCSPSNGNKNFWLSVGTDASVLHTERNEPVYDWKISVIAPLKLENRLPCSAEFTIWEKTKEGNFVERQRGVISSRENVFVYYADVQKSLYLSLYAQGGWVLEKDPALVLDASSNDRVSLLWMVHQQSKRRIRLRVEYDMGGNHAATKSIRFFVPYWITNDTSLPLAYRTVEVDSTDNNADADSIILSRAVKSAKIALRNPSYSMDRRFSFQKNSLHVLEIIEDSSPLPSMLSPQDYGSRGSSIFQSQKDSYPATKVGIAVAVRNSNVFSQGISLYALENKERIDVKAYSSDGRYYKLSAQLNMGSDRTKVIRFLPHTLFINRVGKSICLQQCDSQFIDWIHPTDPPKAFGWRTNADVESLKVRLNGYNWSTPFSVSYEGVMRIFLVKENGTDILQLRVDVRSGTKSSRYEVVFRPNSFSSPYRIENRSMFLSIRFHQVGGSIDSWQSLCPNSAASFMWEDLGEKQQLELCINGSDSFRPETYNIDEIIDYQPVQATDGPMKAIRVTVLKEDKLNVVRILDWLPENESNLIVSKGLPALKSGVYEDQCHPQSPSNLEEEFHVVIEISDLGVSVVDHMPEEILYLSVQSLLLGYSTGLGSAISRCKLRMRGLQVDNQLPLTPMPVLFRPQRAGEESDHVLKLSMTMQSNGSLDLHTYPYIEVQGPENSAFIINIHEPIIWRLHEMIQQVSLSRLYDTQTTLVSVDPVIQIGVLNLSEFRFKLSMTMSPSLRPRGVLGFWSSLMTALGNTENMPVKINQRVCENLCMRQSAMTSNAILNIRKDLLSQPLQLLSGVDILGNASSALGHMSKGVAALSMDKKFIQSRQRQENKGVEDIGDVIREGGGALAKGLFRGVTGILTKPLEGAKSSGVEGFVQGVGKGIIGAAAQPVSGVLDLLSKTTEGANAVRMKIISSITSEEQLLRRRLPRVIGGDNLLRPYDDYSAEGQVILQLAECGSFFGQVDLFKVRGKFALSDAYEDHFLLPKGKIFVITHRRALLLQQPSAIVSQRKFNPARDPCSVLWDVLWDDLITMELTHGKKDLPKSPCSRLILYLKPRQPELREQIRIIKCSRDSDQASEIYSSIERAMTTYGPTRQKDIVKCNVAKPYSPRAECSDVEMTGKDSGLGQTNRELVMTRMFRTSVSRPLLSFRRHQNIESAPDLKLSNLVSFPELPGWTRARRAFVGVVDNTFRGNIRIDSNFVSGVSVLPRTITGSSSRKTGCIKVLRRKMRDLKLHICNTLHRGNKNWVHFADCFAKGKNEVASVCDRSI
ncbi:hypothetical protein MLD38_018571 [Melastoma candidum]|uniref:Uncharacterized protein n=1 Tax=Melastoma candidum TaxID=119954 RepID=A0ACB9QU67_9MYRT|nr:hypothetical protein MLD38_018571 [Melastoma candidum]